MCIVGWTYLLLQRCGYHGFVCHPHWCQVYCEQTVDWGCRGFCRMLGYFAEYFLISHARDCNLYSRADIHWENEDVNFCTESKHWTKSKSNVALNFVKCWVIVLTNFVCETQVVNLKIKLALKILSQLKGLNVAALPCERIDVFWLTLKMGQFLHHTHSHFMALCPGLPEWAGTRRNIHPLPPIFTLSSNILYQLPSTTIHSILLVQITCLAVLFHNLSLVSLWSSLEWDPLRHISCSFCVTMCK